MALLSVYCGETSSSSQIFLLRFLDRTIETIKYNVAHIFANFLSSDPFMDPNTRHGDSVRCCSCKELMKKVDDCCQSRKQDWFPNNKECNDDGDPQAVFNVLDTMLKGSLERLKTMRENISLVKKGLVACTLDVNYTRHVGLIREMCIAGKLGPALLLRRKMIQRGVIPDVLTHNFIMNGLSKCRDLDKMVSLIQEMMEIGPSPNCATYNTLIKGYCLTNDLDKALDVSSTMADSGINPNRVTVNILLHAFCKGGRLEDAKKLLREILDTNENSKSGVITSTIRMDGCIKRADIAQAFDIWDAMFQKEMPVDVVAYNVLIRGVCLSQDIKHAYSYACQMLKRGLPPDIYTYNTILSGLCKGGKLDEACYIHGVMSRMGVSPDEISGKMIIQGLCFLGNVFKAHDHLLCMLEKSMVPKPHVWNLIIDGYGSRGDLANALGIRDHMLSLGVNQNLFTYNALINAQVRGGNLSDAYALTKEMLLNDNDPGVVTYNLLIGAACNAGNIRFALYLFYEMLRKCQPDIITFTELIRGHCMRGSTKEAEELLAKLQNSGLEVDHVPYQILIQTYCRVNKPDLAFDLYKKWLTRNKYLPPLMAMVYCAGQQNYWFSKAEAEFSFGVPEFQRFVMVLFFPWMGLEWSILSS